MPSFFLAFLAAAAATAGGREAVRVARLSAAHGISGWILLAAFLACAAASALAARVGAGIAAQLAPEAKTMLIALALLLAAVELVLLRPGRTPAEPTRSFGAVTLVLGAGQLTAAAGFLIFALAGATGAPWAAGAGGALGSAGVLAVAWSAGNAWEARVPLKPLRFGLAALLLVAAIVTGLSAKGLTG